MLLLLLLLPLLLLLLLPLLLPWPLLWVRGLLGMAAEQQAPLECLHPVTPCLVLTL